MPALFDRFLALCSVSALTCALALLPPALAQGPLAPGPAEAGLEDLDRFPQGQITVRSAAGAQRYDIWIADTPERQQQGLMYVRELAANRGMLFVHSQPRPTTFWMKNTYIPLDLLFIDALGRIVFIEANATPLSLRLIGPSVPVKAVLELRGGESAARGIRVGDRAIHPAFRGVP